MSERYYYEIIDELGNREVITTAELVEVDADESTYTIPVQAVMLLGAFYNDRFLNEASIQELESFFGLGWRNKKGAPVAFTREQESKRDFRLFPAPTEPNNDFSFVHGLPLGIDYPLNSIVVIATETRDDLPQWLELPIVFEILAREYARESDHQDMAFAAICKGAAQMFFEMVL